MVRITTSLVSPCPSFSARLCRRRRFASVTQLMRQRRSVTGGWRRCAAPIGDGHRPARSRATGGCALRSWYASLTTLAAGVAEPSAGGYGSAPLFSSPRPATHLWGPSKHTGSWPWSRRAGCQASPDPRASVRPIATSAHPARCLTERWPRRRGTWGPCRRADLRRSVSCWPASSSIMYGCIVFTY
jgi:hypothetical protein